MSTIKKIVNLLLDPRSRAAAKAPGRTPDNAVEIGANGVPAYPSHHLSVGELARNLPLMLGTFIVLALLLTLLFGPLWVEHDPFITSQSILPHFDTETNKLVKLPFPPSAEYPLGTDAWGNDMVSLLIYGARVTLITGAYITILRVLLGALLGGLAGWRPGGRFDRAVNAVAGTVGSVPMLLSSMILVYALGIQKGVLVFVIALAVVGWTEVAQYIRSEVLVIREMPYIEGAEAVGLSETQILVRHVLPNVLAQLVILSFLEMGAVLILVAELGFLKVFIGGGSLFTADPVFGSAVHFANVPEWGALVAEGAPSVRSYPHLVMAPALAFFVAIVGMNAFGEGLRRLLTQIGVSTGFLLRRRTLLGVAAFLIVSSFVIRATGPNRSFDRVAESFSGQQAHSYLEEMATATPEATREPVAAYIEQAYRDLDLQRGWKPEGQITQTYAHKVPTENGEETVGVIAFFAGYDLEYSTELTVLLAPYSEPGDAKKADFSGVALMLETARLWHAQKVDPRRSLLLVAWRGPIEDALAFITIDEAFSHLPVPTRAIAEPYLIFDLDHLAAGGDRLWWDEASDPALVELLADAAAREDVSTAAAAVVGAVAPLSPLPTISLRWSNDGDATQLGDRDKLQVAGQVLNQALLRLVRQPNIYWGT